MAKGIDLGLESLLSATVPTKNFVEDLADFFVTSMEVMEQANVIIQAYNTIDTLNGIQNCIRKHGVTQSLETLYGENFRGAASMEEDTAEAKQSIWKRLADMIRKFCAWVKAWVQRFIGTRGRTAKKLQEIETKAAALPADATIKFNGFAKPGAAATVEDDEAKEVTLTGGAAIKSCVVAHYQALNNVDNIVKKFNEKLEKAAKEAEAKAKQAAAGDDAKANTEAQETMKETKSATMFASKVIASGNALMAAINGYKKEDAGNNQ